MCKHLLLIPIFFLLISCSTVQQYQVYQGNKLAPEEIVIIKGEGLAFSCHNDEVFTSVKFCAFDDDEFDTCQRSVEFLPGQHSFRLKHSVWGVKVRENTYQLEFDAGELYCLSLPSGASEPKLTYLGKYNKQTTEFDPGAKYINLSSHIKIESSHAEIEPKHALKEHPLLPKDLNNKGLFNIHKDLIKQSHVSKIIASDFLYEDKGSLTERNVEHILSYDTNGNLTLSSGSIDQSGDRSDTFIYDGDSNLVEKLSFNGLNATGKADVTVVYKNSNNLVTDKKSYNTKGVLLGSSTLIYDEHGNNTVVNNFDAENQLLESVIKEYDEFNNIEKRIKANSIIVYSYEGDTIIMTVKFLNGGIHSTYEYVFNNNGSLKSYSRTSGDGEYWDKYVYSYNENGLPSSKVHSKKEFIVQDPYVLTKYEYVNSGASH